MKQCDQSKLTEAYPDPQKTQSQEVIQSERLRSQTEKMLDFRQEEMIKRERRFITTCTNFKSEVNFIRIKLKSEFSNAEYGEIIEIFEQSKCIKVYEH